MPYSVQSGASMTCSFGSAPAKLTVLPTNQTMAESQPSANIMDHKPFVNIAPFGMCSSLANPTVAAATAAAQGVLTPQPCVPNTQAPWTPGSPTVLISRMPAVNNNCKCYCTWAGVIQITNPGGFKHEIA